MKCFGICGIAEETDQQPPTGVGERRVEISARVLPEEFEVIPRCGVQPGVVADEIEIIPAYELEGADREIEQQRHERGEDGERGGNREIEAARRHLFFPQRALGLEEFAEQLGAGFGLHAGGDLHAVI